MFLFYVPEIAGGTVLLSEEESIHCIKVLRLKPGNPVTLTDGKGFFYEGTGQYAESSIRKTVYHSGEVVKYKKLASDLFGEGITLLDGEIYQVTYRNKVGFVYDMETFEQKRRIYYQNQEGWGLTNDGKNIIMSDGTHVLYFMDPEYFSVFRKIEVYDNTQAIDSLNELEFIDNLLKRQLLYFSPAYMANRDIISLTRYW